MSKIDHYVVIFVSQNTARHIAKVSNEAKLNIDEETYVSSFRPHLMDIVHAWANGASFAQVCRMTSVFEGTVAKDCTLYGIMGPIGSLSSYVFSYTPLQNTSMNRIVVMFRAV